MPYNRRRSARHPVGFYVEQFVNDEPYRCFTTDLSSIGLYMERLVEPMDRASSFVQLEIKLPKASDSIWAAGEVVYDRIDSLFHGTAIRFTGMARAHQRWIREWLRETERSERFDAMHPVVRKQHVVVHRPERSFACA